jgi:hypothetical protein
MNYGYPYNAMPQYPYGYQQQMQQRGQMAMQQPMTPTMQMPQQPMPMQFEPPIREIKFVTSKEAEAYIVMPNSSSLLIDKQEGIAYLKSADIMGQSFMEMYHFSKNAPQGQINAQETPKASNPIDLSAYITNEQFDKHTTATQEEFRKLYAKIDELRKIPQPRPAQPQPQPQTANK